MAATFYAYFQLSFQGQGIFCHVTRSTRSLNTWTNVYFSIFFFISSSVQRSSMQLRLSAYRTVISLNLIFKISRWIAMATCRYECVVYLFDTFVHVPLFLSTPRTRICLMKPWRTAIATSLTLCCLSSFVMLFKNWWRGRVNFCTGKIVLLSSFSSVHNNLFPFSSSLYFFIRYIPPVEWLAYLGFLLCLSEID